MDSTLKKFFSPSVITAFYYLVLNCFSNTAVADKFELISVAIGGAQANNKSFASKISADGRYVAFASAASNLVAGDTNNGIAIENGIDIFVRDRLNNKTERVSIASDGTEANASSGSGEYGINSAFDEFDISSDGRYVVFSSLATNLVPNDINGVSDIFLHDRSTGKTELISKGTNGTQGNFKSITPSVSGDGRYVAFASTADNLVSNDTNGSVSPTFGLDVFIHDRQTGITERVSISSTGEQNPYGGSSPVISADGRIIAFATSSLGGYNTALFAHDRISKTTEKLSFDSQGNSLSGVYYIDISSDGRFVSFTAENSVDAIASAQIRVRDRLNLITDGRWVESTLVPWTSTQPAISADGRHVAYTGYGQFTSLFIGGYRSYQGAILRRDRVKGVDEPVSLDSLKATFPIKTYYESWPDISADGRFVSFTSERDDLTTNDSNRLSDIFVRDMDSGSDNPPQNPNSKSGADIVVTQSESSDPAQMGSELVYTVTIANQGPLTANTVKLTNIVSSKAKLLEIAPSQGTCNGKGTVVCRIGTLLVNSSATVQIKLIPKINKNGKPYTLTNIASANSKPKDNNLKNNTSIKEKTSIMP